MKTSESHGSKKQALQRQAEQLLPSITAALSKLGYQAIAHQRISQQNSETIIYQGLSRATHEQFGEVMIKWQIIADNSPNLILLEHEVAVLKALNKSENTQTNAVAPSLLAFESLYLKQLEQEPLLTLLVIPHYSQGSLAKYLKQPLTNEQKYQFIVQSAQLIANLHNSGWLHNDIKPSNILFINADSLLLTDFALAESIDRDNEDQVKVEYSAGTPAYLAPERWQGQGATMQSDIYAFGIMMYEVLVGERPFKVAVSSSEPKVAMKEWAIQHCQQSIAKLPMPYDHYQVIINKALAKRVESRYLNMHEVLNGLNLLESL